MNTDAVELLERAIGYTRGTLGEVSEDLLCRRTPCVEWSLGQLLTHMADGLDAFTEASRGVVDVTPPPPAPVSVQALRDKACTLLGAWSTPAARSARVGDLRLASDVLLRTAALEVAVHGWDVGQATGAGTPLPTALARDLLPVGRLLVTAQDRGVRFGPALPTVPGTPADRELVALLGRSVLQPSQ